MMGLTDQHFTSDTISQLDDTGVHWPNCITSQLLEMRTCTPMRMYKVHLHQRSWLKRRSEHATERRTKHSAKTQIVCKANCRCIVCVYSAGDSAARGRPHPEAAEAPAMQTFVSERICSSLVRTKQPWKDHWVYSYVPQQWVWASHLYKIFQ